MRLVVQRVSSASVSIGGEVVGQIGRGLVVLVGVARDDDEETASKAAEKTWSLRIFSSRLGGPPLPGGAAAGPEALTGRRQAAPPPKPPGETEQSASDLGLPVLAVSQFTLLADTSRGRRPGFSYAAPPEEAEPVYDAYCRALEGLGAHVERGVFGAMMDVALVNDGPYTIVLDL